VQTAESGRHTAMEEIVGTVRAKRRATLEAKVSGRIERLEVFPGQQVKAGQLLAQLDVREVQARLDQANAMRQQAEGDLKRYSALLQQQAVTQAEFDAIQARQRVAQATAVEMETMLDHARVVAPFDGVITRKLADVGDLAAPGKPLLEMEDPAALRLDADVPEALISRIEHGTAMPVRIASLPDDLQGVVSEMAPSADPGSRTFQVKYDLPAVPGLRAGQFGRVAVPLGESSALWVPASAVVQRGQMEIVFVAKSQQATLRLVKTGKRRGEMVELVSGVSAGEQVVVEGAAQLRDGQRIEIKP
jgi:RND family efflux transporter MFP subunit